MGFFTDTLLGKKPDAEDAPARPPPTEADRSLALSGAYVPVASSDVAGFSYDKESRRLTVHFHAKGRGRHVYPYTDVPPELAERLLTELSVGRFVQATFVKTGWPFE